MTTLCLIENQASKDRRPRFNPKGRRNTKNKILWIITIMSTHSWCKRTCTNSIFKLPKGGKRREIFILIRQNCSIRFLTIRRNLRVWWPAAPSTKAGPKITTCQNSLIRLAATRLLILEKLPNSTRNSSLRTITTTADSPTSAPNRMRFSDPARRTEYLTFQAMIWILWRVRILWPSQTPKNITIIHRWSSNKQEIHPQKKPKNHENSTKNNETCQTIILMTRIWLEQSWGSPPPTCTRIKWVRARKKNSVITKGSMRMKWTICRTSNSKIRSRFCQMHHRAWKMSIISYN